MVAVRGPSSRRRTRIGGGPITLSYRNAYSSSSDLTTYTFSTCDIGTAASNRIVVVAVSGWRSTDANNTSVTIAGVSATFIERAFAGASSGAHMELWAAAVPSGTTGDIVVVFAGAQNRAGIGVWAMYGGSVTAHDTLTSTANPATGTVDCEAGGAIIGAVAWGTTTGSGGPYTWAWTNLTEKYDGVVENNANGNTGASDAFATAQSSLTVTATPNPSEAEPQQAMVVAAFSP